MLARAPARAAWLLHGEETFLVERALALLTRRLGDAGVADVRTRWGDDDADALGAALEDLASPLLFGGAPALVIRRAEALSGASDALVLGTIARIAPPSCVILVARALDGRRTLRTTFERAGGAVAFPRVSEPRALREWGERLARERGQAIRPAALDLLVDRSSLDLAGLDAEIEKASLYAGAGVAIDRDHVESVGAFGQSAAVEELADCLARGDRTRAHRVVAALLRGGEPPIRLVAFLAASLRRGLHVTELREQGYDDDTVAARLGMPAWLIRRVGRGRSAEALERALETLRDLDLDLKRSRPPAIAFDAALVGLAGPTPPRRS